MLSMQIPVEKEESYDNIKQSRRTNCLNIIKAIKSFQESGGGWGWGSWGSSILSTATKSVTTFTSQVGKCFDFEIVPHLFPIPIL